MIRSILETLAEVLAIAFCASTILLISGLWIAINNGIIQ